MGNKNDTSKYETKIIKEINDIKSEDSSSNGNSKEYMKLEHELEKYNKSNRMTKANSSTVLSESKKKEVDKNKSNPNIFFKANEKNKRASRKEKDETDVTEETEEKITKSCSNQVCETNGENKKEKSSRKSLKKMISSLSFKNSPKDMNNEEKEEDIVKKENNEIELNKKKEEKSKILLII
jgi:hypothetical protein